MKPKTLKRRRAISDDDISPPSSEDEDKGKGKGRGYSEDKDKCIKKIGTIEGESERAGEILTRIMSYNGGPKKIAVMMHGTKSNGDEWFAKLGRITPAQAKKLRIHLKKAIRFLKNEEGEGEEE